MKKIAVIGFGFMGVVHAKNIIASGNLELCAIVDKRENIFSGIENTGNKGNLDLPIERLKKTPVYKSLEKCCGKEKPDAVSICVPLFLHYELTKKALELGLDVLLEKPFCSKPEEGRELIELAEKKKKILMVAHCIRFSPHWKFLADCIRDERYGKLKFLSTCRMSGEPTWGVWQDEKIKKTCGGAVMDLLIHDIDFTNYCFGTPSSFKIGMNRDEYWELSFNYGKAAPSVSIKGGFMHRHSAFVSEYAANFERSGIRYSTLQPETIHIGTDAGAETLALKGDAYFNEMEYFAECIEKRKSPSECLPQGSLKSIEICREIMN